MKIERVDGPATWHTFVTASVPNTCGIKDNPFGCVLTKMVSCSASCVVARLPALTD